MRRIFKKKRSLSVLSILMSAVAVLCAGFFITMCGSGPQTSSKLINRGAYAIDFSATSTPDMELGFIDASSIGDMSGLTGFTIEAWVMRKATTTLAGGIFSRSQFDGDLLVSNGIALMVDPPTGNYPDNEPVFAEVIDNTEYVVSPSATSTTFTNNQWDHVAVVFTNQSHGTGVHSTCRGVGVYATTSAYHLDLYMNGTFVNCAAAAALPAFAYGERIGRLHTNFPSSTFDYNDIGINTKLNAVIDEVRFWKVARTGSQIQQCMGQEIGVSGACALSSDLIGYWRLNTGAGFTASDSSGGNNSGTISYCVAGSGCDSGGTATSWTNGWTAGYPF